MGRVVKSKETNRETEFMIDQVSTYGYVELLTEPITGRIFERTECGRWYQSVRKETYKDIEDVKM